MQFTETFYSEIRKCSGVIIYGFGDIGKTVLDYIIDFETCIKFAGNSCAVKFFATTYTDRQSKRNEIRGIKIRSIYELTDYAQDSLVIVATREKYHQDIENTLNELDFKNVIFVKHNDYIKLQEAMDNRTNIINNRIGQYQLTNQIQLNRLREKVRSGKKAKVLFMVHDSSVFGAASIYSEMLNDAIFDPFIFVVSRRDVNYADFYADVMKDVTFFESRGYRVICGYDENQNPVDIHLLSPDIIFYDLPKMHGSRESHYFRLDMLNWEYLTCYLPYGLYMIDSFYYHYHTICIRESWKFFLPTNEEFKRASADTEFCGFNLVKSGYPKFDDYYSTEINIPEKINNDKPIVIYAPHHSFGVSNNLATFDLYGNTILEIAKNNPQINFIFKPHPLFKFQIKTRYKQGKINVSPEDYQKYRNEWESLPNGVIVEGGDYIGLFRKSACMITDSGSFIGEYLPSLKPCIYIFNPRKSCQMDMYTPLAQKILNTYYVVNSEEELLKEINDVILNGSDPKNMKRKEILDKCFYKIGCSGKYIVEHIKEELL